MVGKIFEIIGEVSMWIGNTTYMNRENMIFNVIVYALLTAFFVYIFVREKKITGIIKEKERKLSDCLSDKLGITTESKRNGLFKTISGIESLFTAIILVLVIQAFYIGNFVVPTGSMEPIIVPGDRLFGNMAIYKFKAPEIEDIIVFKEPIQNKVLYTKRLMGEPGDRIKIKDDFLYINDEKVTTRNYTPLGELGISTWVVPKKGDNVKIVPGGNYTAEYLSRNIDVGKIQEILLENPGEIKQAIPSLEFYVNGERTGMILDLIHDADNLSKLMGGETLEITLDDNYYLALGDNTNGSFDSRMWGFVNENRIRGKALVRFWPINRISFLK